MNARTNIPTFDTQAILGYADIGVEDCWSWRGSMYNNGYGKYGRAGYMAHRIAYEMLIGSIPAGMFLDHTCHTSDCNEGMRCKHRSCINPNHLEVVTKGENVLRGNSISAVNARKTHCHNGHEFTQANTSIELDGSRRCRKCSALRANQYRTNKT